ncbi:uncharacterized mitochondrial protein AtMg00310-like [Rutidosis leptorrhynchoides]|uniref:uncharacterized mitochondrial protein AtMg00310-like n=1 Tax=Rutidosis leptorrhynchoides TaxID=125765 RepID=UPI003A98F81D
MNRVASWNPLQDRFTKRLSGWKANLLSIGGHLTLIKAVLGSLGIYFLSIYKCPETVLNNLESVRASFFWGSLENNKKMHWVRWDQVLASTDHGGLGVGSLRAFNQALLLKWIWCFVNKPDSKWAEVIRAIYGEKAGLDGVPIRGTSVWSTIVKLFFKLKSDGVIPDNVLRVKIGNARNTRFWLDNWKGDGSFMVKYNRLDHLETNKNCFIADRFVNGSWRWEWVREQIGSRNVNAL